MIGGSRHIVVTGAGGFIGAHLAQRLLTDPNFANDRITLGDLSLAAIPGHPRARRVVGDFGDPAVRRNLLGDRADIVFHLAGVLGGAAEADYDMARRVNVDATLSLLEALRSPDAPPRVVFASSIAVFGPDMPGFIDDETPTSPTMIYGAQKRMIEVILDQFSARGWIDGLGLRLPGIVARPAGDARLKSAFLNNIFHAYVAGEDITLPVSAEGTCWMISIPTCIDALVHAGLLSSDILGSRRCFTLPTQRVAFRDLVQALRARFPDSRSKVRFQPIAEIEAQFASQPSVITPLADALGFRHDGDLATLVERALSDVGS